MKRFLLLPLLLISCEKEETTSPVTLNKNSSQKVKTLPHAMLLIPGGTYTRGTPANAGEASMFPEEVPAHEVTIEPFYLDEHEVTNAQFAQFVQETGYLTQAEKGWSNEDFPKAPPEALKPGALVFTPPKNDVSTEGLHAVWQWWQMTEGASWRHPQGPHSSIADKMDHPVVCVTWEDARAYAKWIGKRLPTEAEWERAARGGLKKNTYVWGNEAKPDPASWPANIFTGDFPENDSGIDGFKGTAPVKSYPPNAFGLYDMAGNVWEHCSDFYWPNAYQLFISTGKSPERGISQPMIGHFMNYGRWPEEEPDELAKLHVTKGGSFLCHYSYCMRYRPAARHYSESLAPANHTGFRCALSVEN